MSLKEKMRELCPNYLPLRRLLARIKIDQYERYLISTEDKKRGEINAQERESIVSRYSAKWPRYIASVNKKIDELFKAAPAYKERPDLESIRVDMLFCRLAYGFQPNEYLSFKLETKSAKEREKYVSDIDRWRYIYKMNDSIDYIVLGDKAKTYEAFKNYFGRDAISIENEKDYALFCEFVMKYPIFVKKEVFKARGESVSLVNIADADDSKLKEIFHSMISQGKHILEERVIQDDKMAVLNPSSVNTVRCATVYTRHGIEILFCFLRVGRQGLFVDNGGAGGIEIGINIDTGKLDTDGYDHYGMCFERHPDSGVKFSGFQLPCWLQMLDLCKEMAAKLPTVKFIAWDMAFTSQGWVLIEGNNTGQMMGPQVTTQSGLKEKIDSVLMDVDLLA